MAVTQNPTSHTLELNRATLTWELDQGKLSFFGLPSAIFWIDPSLYQMLAPLAEKLGYPLFRLLIAASSSIGTDQDYQGMVTSLASDFEEGFLAWGHAVGAAGWGRFELVEYDRQAQTASVLVTNAWELQMIQNKEQHWGCPFLFGKLIGIFSHAFGTACWAEEHIDFNGAAPSVRFEIFPSDLSLSAEVKRLSEEQEDAKRREFEEEVDLRTREIQAIQEARVHVQEEILRAQETLIAELSTPVLPILDHVVLIPLVGQMDSRRAHHVTEALLKGVAEHRARFAILDITGLPMVDTGFANSMLRCARAVRLLGTTMIITGIRPEVAQIMVSLGIDMTGVLTCSTLQAGIAIALKQIG
jgi:rsbT co-antagonist protein RsbR